uniref:Synaptopodin n=1 Tax=Knipowitschia caucasica TaxID=637954 RepID=A0AAV2MKH6_KNICA
MEQGHTTLERGVSCPGRPREHQQYQQDVPDSDASWSKSSEFNKDQMSRKTSLEHTSPLASSLVSLSSSVATGLHRSVCKSNRNSSRVPGSSGVRGDKLDSKTHGGSTATAVKELWRGQDLTRSTSLSEKELKEARVRSQIIAAQLTVPSKSTSRGVQLFNRRRQRVNAFTLESGRRAGSREDNVTPNISSNKLTWAERSSEEKDLNLKNSTGVDAKKKMSKSIPEPSTEEELMALGAEASNFLAKEEVKEEAAKSPEWASSLKSSRTRPRAEHRPEQALTNVAGKGAELFAKRQSRMDKYVVENPKPAHQRSPSPTMSLPPSWVYPSNMPGRVKAIAKNSEMSAQLTQNLIAQQAAKQKPKPKVPTAQQAPQPAPPPALNENGCSKIEMDLSRHRPYQLDSSLFILKPAQPDPLSTLPRGAPTAKNIMRSQSLPRQSSMPSNPLSPYRSQGMPPPLAMSPCAGLLDAQQRISSPAFSPERVASPRTGTQAPRPTFSARKAGLEGQTQKESLNSTSKESPAPRAGASLTRRFSSPADPSTVVWSPARPSVFSPVSTPRGSRCQSPLETHSVQYRPPQTPTSPSPWGSRCQSPANTQGPTSPTFRPTQTTTSPLPSPWGSRCQSPMMTQFQTSTAFTSRPSQTATSLVSPPWATRSKSPVGNHNPPALLTVLKPAHTSPVSPPWGSRSQSPMVNHTVSSSRASNTTATSPFSPWGSRCQSPALSQSSLPFSPKPLNRSAASSPVPASKDTRCMSPIVSNTDTKANHRLLAKNIINAAKRKNSVSPGALSGQSLPITPMGTTHHGFDSHKPPMSPFHSRPLGAQSPTFTSPPPTPTQVCSPARLYNTRSLTDSDASVESEDSGLRSPGLYYNSLPRGWGGSLRVKRSTVSTDL